jgi:L-cysteine:1D-myo-inositol 2-amino-2-deoxy-alpha-D-glucopyranoside ligase
VPPIPKTIVLPELSMATYLGERNFSGLNRIRMYVCGITPYDATHLGHAATYLTFDLVNRYLKCQSKEVDFVENITDIDDPLLERAHRDHIDWKSLAVDQIALYKDDMTALRVIPPSAFVPATQVMDLVSKVITRLDQNGYVYQLEGDLYFDISTFLTELPISIAEALIIFSERGGDPYRAGKRNPLDPILWLANKNDEPGWESVHGFGRPGWHIECCVISLRYLNGENFMDSSPGNTCIEIQGGGSDLIFPHHFMSAAQAMALTGKPFALAYLHSGMVGLNGEKMSKSKGNLVFVSKLLQSGIDPMYIRYALMKSHYSADRMWNEDQLIDAEGEIAALRQSLSRESVAPTLPVINAIATALSNDLDTPLILEILQKWHLDTQNGIEGGHAGELSRALDSLLGLAL